MNINNKIKAYTTWSTATINFEDAVASLEECLKTGRNAWLEIRKNGKQSFPVKCINPKVKTAEGWTMSVGVPTPNNLGEHSFTLPIEKELTLHYVPCFGEEKAIINYYKTGELTPGNVKSAGICHAVKKVDLEKFRGLEPNSYDRWTYFWKPRQGTIHTTDDSIEDVYTVCFNSDMLVDSSASLENARQLRRIA